MLRIIKSLYRDVRLSVLVDGKASRSVPLKQGVRQGLQPISCPLCLLRGRAGCRPTCCGLNERPLHSLLYADDVVITAETAEELQHMINAVDAFCAKWRIDLNIDKSKVMVVSERTGAPPLDAGLGVVRDWKW